MILKRILSRWERCRDYIATERAIRSLTAASLATIEHPLFLWQLKAQRKSLAKRNAAKAVSPSADGEEASSASTRKLLKKLDQNFTYCKNVG